MIDLKTLQEEYRKYLAEVFPKAKPISINTYVTDAFYPYNNAVGMNFADIFINEASLNSCLELLKIHFDEKAKERGQEFPNSHANRYLFTLRKFKEFLDTNYGGVEALLNLSSTKINYFWLNANPEIWSFLDINIDSIETFSLLNENGNKRQNPTCFAKAKAGDKVLGYESQKIVALLEIVQGAHYEDGEDVISVQIKELFSNPISIENLKNDPVLKNSATVNRHQGTLFELTEQEFNRINRILKPTNLLDNLIKEYHSFKTSKEYDEQYKWDYLEKNKSIFDDYDNLPDKIKQLGAPNFMPYFWKTSAFRHLADLYTEDFRNILINLFDESIDLISRISIFRSEIKTILKKSPSWNKKDNIDPGVESASFFLFIKDYKKYLLFTRVTPFIDIAKAFSMYDLLNHESKETRYINWQNYCIDVLIPKMNEILKIENTLLDAQDFIWFAGKQVNQMLEETEEKEEGEIMTKNIPLNQILYGPPGTGKTYNTALKAVEILEPETDVKSLPREEIESKYKEYRKNNQIKFVTFHQSYSYEEFVEGIRPDLSKDNCDLKYILHTGIFKEIAEFAKSEYIETNQSIDIDLSNTKIFKMSLGSAAESDVYEYCMREGVIALGYGDNIDFASASTRGEIINIVQNNEVLKHKTSFIIDAVERFKLWMRKDDLVFISDGLDKIRAIGVIDGDYYFDEKTEIRYNQFRKVKWIYQGEDIPVAKFLNNKKLIPMSIYQFYDEDINKAYLNQLFGKSNNPKKKNYVLIIDEINRGEISKIFGELITLIEDTKRTNKENLEIQLPYSGKPFSLPPNLYIIGTMNTADRSIALLDIALRRRFDFIPMYPRSEIITEDGNSIEVGEINRAEFLDKLNERIGFLLDDDHKIGHSYLMNIKNYAEFNYAFTNRILPLLSEYFYNDYEKIAKVLNQDEDYEGEYNWSNKESTIIHKKMYDSIPKYFINDAFSKEALIKVYQ